MAKSGAKRPSSSSSKGEPGAKKRGGEASAGKDKSNRAEARPSREEYEPIMSGRFVTALALALAMVVIPLSPLGHVIAKESPESTKRALWKVGESATVHITVTTADYEKLGCADPRTVEGAHCAYKSQTERFEEPDGSLVDDNKLNVLQPYRTTDSQLLLMSGLWAQPAIATRLHREPSRNVSEKKLARFVASCEVKFLQEWKRPQVRWDNRGKFNPQDEQAMVAKPISCEILQEHQDKAHR